MSRITPDQRKIVAGWIEELDWTAELGPNNVVADPLFQWYNEDRAPRPKEYHACREFIDGRKADEWVPRVVRYK